MYWSIYDVLMLVSGLITLVIVVAPVSGITARTRVTAAGVGGGLVLVSVVLASIPFFRYPSVVIIAPVIALLSVIAVIGKAVRGSASLQVGEQGHGRSPQDLGAPLESGAPGVGTAVVPELPADLPATELMELAARDRSRWVEIARHPSTYPALLEWLAQHGGADVRNAVAARRAVESEDSTP